MTLRRIIVAPAAKSETGASAYKKNSLFMEMQRLCGLRGHAKLNEHEFLP